VPGLPLIVTQIEAPIRLTKGEQALLALPNRLKNLPRLMKEGIAPAMNRMQMLHWQTEGRRFDHPWAPLEPATIRKKRRKGTLDRGILHDTEHLFKAVFRARASDDRLKQIPGGFRLLANTKIFYAIFHQVGTQFMAERQVIPNPLPQSFVKECRNIIRVYLLTGDILQRSA
jgi:hypothetical protein